MFDEAESWMLSTSHTYIVGVFALRLILGVLGQLMLDSERAVENVENGLHALPAPSRPENAPNTQLAGQLWTLNR